MLWTTARLGQSAWPRRPPGWSARRANFGSCRAARRGDGRSQSPRSSAENGCASGDSAVRLSSWIEYIAVSRRARRRRCGRCARRPSWPRRAQRTTDGTGRARPAPHESSAGLVSRQDERPARRRPRRMRRRRLADRADETLHAAGRVELSLRKTSGSSAGVADLKERSPASTILEVAPGSSSATLRCRASNAAAATPPPHHHHLCHRHRCRRWRRGREG